MGRMLALAAFAIALLAGALAFAHGHHASTFGKAKFYPVDGPDQLRVVAVGDLNGDGRNDILVSDNFETNAWQLLGTKHGFKAASAIPIGSVSRAFALGDLNHDGLPDIANAGEPLTVTSKVGGAYHTSSFNFNSDDVAIADVNHDHNPDVVASGDLTDEVGVVLGTHNGVGGQAVHTYPTFAQPVGLAVGKIDGDKNPDLAVLENDTDVGSLIQVMKGDGHGAFTAGKSRILSSGEADGIVGADFNGDHHLDVAVTQGCSASEPDKVLIALGVKGGFKAPESRNAPQAICTEGPAAADVNGDGRTDLITTELFTGGAGTVDVFRGKGNGRLQAPQGFPDGDGAEDVAIAKLNGDKLPDIVAPSQLVNRVGVLYGKSR